MMDNRLTSAIEKLIIDREKTLLKLIALRTELTSHIDSDDLEDSAPDVLEHEMILSRVRELECSLQSIEHALQKVRQGTYGICECCGEPIDPAHLEIMPETTLCIRCKTHAERPGQTKPSLPRSEWLQEWYEHRLSTN
ncbi:TraR/DksA family transcriptional regulator [Chloroflexota bacterium]